MVAGGGGNLIEHTEREHLKSLESGEHHIYNYESDRIFGTIGNHKKSGNNEQWGYDNKYRKLRGIGEYTKRPNAKSQRRQQPEIGNYAGDADKGSADKGEYP
jgi:hypothetical protein